VVLITLDTTNPEALDVYGSLRGLTPALSRFAQDAILYENARTVAPVTLPSHASMLTGLYPPRHGVRDNGYAALSDDARTVAEYASDAGYATGAFVAAAVLAAPYGLDQGFDHYESPTGDAQHMGGIVERAGIDVTSSAAAWLDEREPGRPVFLWAHYFDVHAPYLPPTSELERAGGDAYLGEVAVLDAAVGALLERLRQEPDFDEMLILIVADHGEGLGRHDEATHALFVYDSTLRVPMLLRLPGAERAGERSRELVSVVDVFPTLLAAMQLEDAASEVDGRSLLDPAAPDRGLYFESYYGYLNYGWSPLAGWIDADGKYIHSAQPELYDPDSDRSESEDLYRPGDERAVRAQAAIEQLVRKSALAPGVDNLADQPDITALGYAGSATASIEVPHPLEQSDLPAPSARLDEHKRLWRALGLVDEGQREEAIAILTEITASNTRNARAHYSLGRLLVEVGRPGDALAPLYAILEQGFDHPNVRRSLVLAHGALGEFRKARRHGRWLEERGFDSPLRFAEPGTEKH